MIRNVVRLRPRCGTHHTTGRPRAASISARFQKQCVRVPRPVPLGVSRIRLTLTVDRDADAGQSIRLFFKKRGVLIWNGTREPQRTVARGCGRRAPRARSGARCPVRPGRAAFHVLPPIGGGDDRRPRARLVHDGDPLAVGRHRQFGFVADLRHRNRFGNERSSLVVRPSHAQSGRRYEGSGSRDPCRWRRCTVAIDGDALVGLAVPLGCRAAMDLRMLRRHQTIARAPAVDRTLSMPTPRDVARRRCTPARAVRSQCAGSQQSDDDGSMTAGVGADRGFSRSRSRTSE